MVCPANTGNMMVIMIAVDKNPGNIRVPAGWTSIDTHSGGPEIGGQLGYKIAAEGETQDIYIDWDTANRGHLHAIEIAGSWDASFLASLGSDKSQTLATSVALAGNSAPNAAAFSMAWYMNDTRKNVGPTVAATNGFTARNVAPSLEPDSNQPGLIFASKVTAANELPQTTISHNGSADGSIGFIVAFIEQAVVVTDPDPIPAGDPAPRRCNRASRRMA